jgi:uracil-DNA glycosylase
MESWDDLQFWSSKEWQTIQERLDALEAESRGYNPDRVNLFASLDNIDFPSVRVAIVGQDPYPNPRLATGVAFSIPDDVVGFPPTLRTIFDEYANDLGLSIPPCGDLLDWSSRGVLLYNSIPTCESWKSMSHDWPEWEVLTREVIEELCKQGIVFVLLGAKARSYVDIINYYDYLTPGENICIELCHPSPRASFNARTETKFVGSRLFSRINDALETLGYLPINWRL